MEGPIIPSLTRAGGPFFPTSCHAPSHHALLGGGWWVGGAKERGGGGGGGRCPEVVGGDQKLQQILSGSFPLLSSEGRQKMEQLCGSLVEFKHPGRPTGGGAGGSGGCGQGCGQGNGVSSGRKKRCKPRELASPLTLKDINQKMVKFVQEPALEDTELKFHLVSRALCKTISALAQVYKLECLIQQKRRLPVASPVLRKTPHTRLASKEEIEPILRRHGQQENFAKVLRGTEADAMHSRTPHQRPQPSHVNPTPSSSSAAVGMVVGGACPALDERNVGNRMLQGMGWRPGSGLGVEGDGVVSPVKAYLRSRHAGLGFTN